MIFRAAIFDMDGLLLDSERICMECFLEAGDLANFPIDRAVYRRCIGASSAMTRQILQEGHGPAFPLERIYEHWSALYFERAHAQPVPLKAGARELLEEISAAGIPIGLATSTEHAVALRKLRNAGIIDFFRFVIGGDQVERGKPHPDIYLAAARRHGIPVHECIAFEDSEHGVRAAHAAGIPVIQVPDLVSPSVEVLALGHRVVASLREVAWSSIGELADSARPSESRAAY